ncbi:type 1 glutamine amidotransferase domain-containing protein [Pseudoalteromonas sp. CNC9-20]|uniref:type 1 glutamine amidotransferase domain-containing protein n=1 Tax=Pseudoalteromonas sp. CNC9-20 TaxID=2917750 RepID=UPI001EF58577|nr:type 1 glutamine amidotransferase domain-containing protein [Pseudoalteromonas sp. CNC9-20]MCG7571521.1 type 1 glutamine amidotransferase domain-containing protein [Pseudoalteromonas sp. CNC9-20]
MRIKSITTLIATVATLVTTATVSANSNAEQVLVLLSSETQMTLADGSTYETGYYLNEFGVPADKLQKAGYDLVLATPKGNAPQVDENSVKAMYFGGNEQEMVRIEKVVANLDGINDTLSLTQVISNGLDQYSGVFIPGGHAPLIDLANNPEVGTILAHFHRQQKPTAAICHGPIALLSAQQNPSAYEQKIVSGQNASATDWLYDGYRMTIFSNPEEASFEASLAGKKLRYYPAKAMAQAGGDMSFADKWQPNVVVDRELITAQNPFSDNKLADALISALRQRSQ